jgi:hypothetical protein
MSEEIVIARAWCKECLRDCFQSYNESTGQHKHIGPDTSDLAAYTADLKSFGFRFGGHRSGTFRFYRYKSQPLVIEAQQLDWLMSMEVKVEAEVEQDW